MEKLEAAIEAILFSAGDSVETGRIAKAIGQDKNTTEKIIRNMMLQCQRSWNQNPGTGRSISDVYQAGIL